MMPPARRAAAAFLRALRRRSAVCGARAHRLSGLAAVHDAELVVINVWEHTLLPPAGSVSVSERYVPDPSQRTTDDLVQVIKEELGDEPPVLVRAHVKQGRPAKVLIEESATADLLVVGKRGHGGFVGLVLGSVSQHVAAYAKCPVTVVH